MTSMSRLQFLSVACGQHENVLMKIFGPPSSHPTHAFHVISIHKFSLFMPPLLIDTTTGLAIKYSKTGACFMYLFMGVLWGHFSSSNSPGILAQELDIHICVNEISFQGVSWLSLTCQTVIGHITWLCVSDSFPKHFQSYRQTWLLKLLLYVLKLKQHCNLPGAHGSTSSSRSVATFAFFGVDQISISHRQRIEP